MEKIHQRNQYEISLDPRAFNNVSLERGPWYESQDAIISGLDWGSEKDRLLRWVRRQMARRLTAVERRCVNLYYFEGLSYRRAAKITGTNASSVFRAVRRSLRKLRAAASQDQLRKTTRRKKRRPTITQRKRGPAKQRQRLRAPRR